MHTNDSCGAATRLLDMGVEPFLVASTVEGVLAQRLLRRVCRSCAVTRPPRDGELPRDFLVGPLLTSDGLVAESVGCRECRGSGFRGRIGCYELLTVDELSRAEIMKRASSSAVEIAARKGQNLTALRESAAELVARRVTTASEALAAVKTA
jgi:general secretion pathway protein E/type IV pilus assembly protein PilB